MMDWKESGKMDNGTHLRHLPGLREENHERCQCGWPMYLGRGLNRGLLEYEAERRTKHHKSSALSSDF
jgi:hypothetical protein